MEAIHVTSFTGYVYPNETVVAWTILIAVYPYLTGLVAGASSVSVLYTGSGLKEYKPVSRLALLAAFGFMLTVPIVLLSHLGHPERALGAMITPNFKSAFSMFGYFAMLYSFILFLEIWFEFRVYNVLQARSSTGIKRLFYRTLTLFDDNISPESQAFDHKWMRRIVIFSILGAHGLHGYVGFVFSSLKSREWWSSELTIVIFVISAIVSGLAAVMLMYLVVSTYRKQKADEVCLRGLAFYLMIFAIFTLFLEGVEFVSLIYKAKEGIGLILEYVTGPMFYRFFIVQFLVGAVVPILILFSVWRFQLSGRKLYLATATASVLALAQVFMMRYNVVIGGQEISKTMRGYLDYEVPLGGIEGSVAAIGAIIFSLCLTFVFVKVFTIDFEDESVVQDRHTMETSGNSGVIPS
ncbi:MAG: polysulfide reductase NrfD [Gammaproteobacteria bacterium]|nr:polysulfide reductase NrfD [Gammaproteobacteria bacterium]MDH5799396.1 polysulfide reductase NrfD [Gammaproteobacteria bacterium]